MAPMPYSRSEKMTLSNQLTLYYKEINNNLCCPNRIKRVFIKEFKNRISEFIEDNPNCSMDDIIENFGTTNDIVSGFSNNENYFKEKAKKNLIIAVTISIIATVVIIVLVLAIYFTIIDMGGDIIVSIESN